MLYKLMIPERFQ